MKFYTNVFQIGNSMLVRGYDNGKHFEDRETFHPTFYVPSKRKRSKWKTLDGQLVCSCLVLAAEAENKNIETIEGMASNGKFDVLQKTWISILSNKRR